MSERSQDRLNDLGRALDRLDEALLVPTNAPLAIDGTIQRFEFTFELMWKVMKDALADYGIDATSPLSTLRGAFQNGWIDDEAVWIKVLKDRNLASHVYREEVADEIYGRIRTHAPRLRQAYETILSLRR